MRFAIFPSGPLEICVDHFICRLLHLVYFTIQAVALEDITNLMASSNGWIGAMCDDGGSDNDGVEWEDGDALESAGANDNDEEDEEFAYSDDQFDHEEEAEVDWEDVASAPATQRSRAPGACESETTHARAGVRGSDAIEDDDDNDETFEPEPDASMDDESDDDGSSATATAHVLTDLQKVNWDQVNRVLQQEAAKADKAAAKATTKRRAVRMSKADKARELVLHETHVLLLLATQLQWNALCQSPILCGLVLSLTSAHSSTFDFSVELSRQPLAYGLELLVRWFHEHFRVSMAASDDDEDEHSALLTEARLLQVFFARTGRDYELAVLFTALCRALRLHCRHACALDALSAQHTRAFEASAAATVSPATSSSRRRKRARTQSSPLPRSRNDADDDSAAAATAPSFWVWTEVFDTRRRAWVHVDAVRKLVGQPHEVESLRGKGAPLSYVVSVSARERVVDVTPRYVSKWSKTLGHRLAHEWMGETLRALNADALRRHAATRAAPVAYEPLDVEDETQVLAAEQAALQAMTESEAMPTSLEGFKKHHLYCLERHLGRFECIHPRKAVGLFKGQAVYLRSHIHVTRSQYQWRRLGREVCEAERETPAKWYVRGKQQTAANGQDDGDNSDDDDAGPTNSSSNDRRAMFGEWQTRAYVAPAVVDGVVPKTEFGNVEVWSEAHVPRHGVHVRLPRIDKVARELGIDYAPALVGFEVKNDRNVPVIDGIVVAQTALELLLDAHAHVQQRTIEHAIEKNQSLVVKRWERLVKRLLLRQRLEDDYGAVNSLGETRSSSTPSTSST